MAFDHPDLTSEERRHAEDQWSRLHQTGRWLIGYFSALIVGLLGWFAYLVFSINLIGSFVLAVIALTTAVSAIRFLPPTKAPEDWLAMVADGNVHRRLVGAGKYRESRTYIGPIRIEYPGHWKSYVDRHLEKPIRARVAIPSEIELGPQTYEVPRYVLAFEGGPSAKFEQEKKLGHYPTTHPSAVMGMVILGILSLVIGGGSLSFLLSDYGSFGESLNALRAFAASKKVYETADEIRAAKHHLGPVEIKNAHVIPAKLVDPKPINASAVMLGGGTVGRVVPARQAIAKQIQVAQDEYAQQLKTYKEDLEKYRQQRGNGLAPVGMVLGRDPEMPRRPQSPSVPLLEIANDEIVAVLVRDPRKSYSAASPPGADPVLASLVKPQAASGNALGVDKFGRVLLYSDAYARESFIGGVAFLVGILLTLAFVCLVISAFRTFIRQRQFTSAVREAYKLQNVTL